MDAIWNRISQLIIGILLLGTMCTKAYAYSYSEAGSEPLFDGREALTSAMIANDKEGALSTVKMLKPTLTVLEDNFPVSLTAPLIRAVEEGKRVEVVRLLNKSFATEIKLRITLAGQHLDDYQKSKILVVKSGRFLDMLIVDMDEESADAAESSMASCLEALGSPGVFGAGKKPANAEQFNRVKKVLFQSLLQF